MPKLESRKVDDTAFKDAVVVTKKDEEESSYFVGKVSEPQYRIRSMGLTSRL